MFVWLGGCPNRYVCMNFGSKTAKIQSIFVPHSSSYYRPVMHIDWKTEVGEERDASRTVTDPGKEMATMQLSFISFKNLEILSFALEIGLTGRAFWISNGKQSLMLTGLNPNSEEARDSAAQIILRWFCFLIYLANFSHSLSTLNLYPAMRLSFMPKTVERRAWICCT